MTRTSQPRPSAPRRRSLLAGTVAALALAACAPLTPREAAGVAPRVLMPAFVLDGRMSATEAARGQAGVSNGSTPGTPTA